MREIAGRGLVLDVCPLSNLRTGAVATLAEHPLPTLLDAGVRCSISTDDPAMFDTDLDRDYEAACTWGHSPRLFYDAGVAGALCDEATRARLRAIGDGVRLGRRSRTRAIMPSWPPSSATSTSIPTRSPGSSRAPASGSSCCAPRPPRSGTPTSLKVAPAACWRATGIPGPVEAWVIAGSWRYLEHDWVAGPGDYIYEPIGDVHTLVVDPAEEMITLFQGVRAASSTSTSEDGVVRVDTAQSKLDLYLAHCREHGLGRPTSSSEARRPHVGGYGSHRSPAGVMTSS